MLGNLTDTIAAIATPIGDSGIGIVRLSGKDALKIADRVFVSKDGRKPSDFNTYTTHYGWIVDKDKEIIDEVILTVMRAPRSYTKEDIVEINCHGGIVALRAVLDLVLQNGARLAGPGEFTKRAFLNGRIDLTQAEAVLDIIRAKTDSALKVGLEQLKGSLSRQLNRSREILLDVLSTLEANIDFPEEETGLLNLKHIRQKLSESEQELKNILQNAKQGKILREGIRVVICGKPNTGKSSLLNALLKCERSIVTPIPGTTRDIIEEIIDIKGIPVRIVDTAGILEPRDLIEKKSVARSKGEIDLADLVILLFDASRSLSREDEILMRRLKQKSVVATINKIDLQQRIEKNKIIDRFKNVIEISAKKLRNINLLEDCIAKLVYNGKVSNSASSAIVSNARHITTVREAQKFIANSLNSLDNKLTLEFIVQDVKQALGCLDEVLGRRFSQDLLDKIFSEFCIGK
ncbi:MAG: tRNA uridine-5-carboxymethylaminomethyl(34) synthesis GTPase MnmE [Candidatus Omnitrophica bacterium]|nr:tRNA uridine-5-carboxymethylaminomethyl(34) synthesis GTPase MnmE [Candidatus Omnitrophota bacterium]